MRSNKARRSQRTEAREPHGEVVGSQRTEAVKRGANSAYLMTRLARDHPKILARLHAGEFPSVRPAAKAAELIKALTPLEDLERAWRRANADDRAAFLVQVHSTNPPPKRVRRLTGALWYERMVEIRQHLLRLKAEGLVENLVESWTPANCQGYRAELRHIIKDLTTILMQIERVMGDEVRSEPEEGEAMARASERHEA
jgi:hypothetical protein